MKKVVVVHSVALNGGDQLLFQALEQGLEKHCESKVVLSTTNNIASQAFLRCKCVHNKSVSYWERVHWRVRKLKGTAFESIIDILVNTFDKIFNVEAEQNRELIKDCDYAVLCPGGFIHEYYDYLYEFKSVIELLVKLNKPIFIVGQSLGPFQHRPEDAKWLLDKVSKIILRENGSFGFLKELNCPEILAKTNVTSDIALGFSVALPALSQKHKNTVFINLRPWKDCSSQELVNKGIAIARSALAEGYEVEFISTCQGVDSYVNDAQIHEDVAQALIKEDLSFDSRVLVNQCPYQPDELIKHMASKGKYYVGMRLHMTISSILAGLPVLNFGYEPKNFGVLETVGLGHAYYSVLESVEKIEDCTKHFLKSDYEAQLVNVQQAVNSGRSYFIKTFDSLADEIKTV